jgi:UDP-glucose 6-dehydrogenase
MSNVHQAAVAIGRGQRTHKVLVTKGTEPFGGGHGLLSVLDDVHQSPLPLDELVSAVLCPDFLREETARGDFLTPEGAMTASPLAGPLSGLGSMR